MARSGIRRRRRQCLYRLRVGRIAIEDAAQWRAIGAGRAADRDAAGGWADAEIGDDIDPAAVESTRLNAANNHVALHAGLPDQAQGLYQVVLANILATPLKVLAPLLCAFVAEGGHLVLAGILSRQVDELKAAYAPWLALDVADELDGWVLMTARRS